MLIGLETGCWKVLDFQSKKTLVEYHDTGNDAIECLQFSPNGLMLAVGNRAGILHLYQVSNGKFNRIGRCMVCNQTCLCQRVRLSCFRELPDVVWPKIVQKRQNYH